MAATQNAQVKKAVVRLQELSADERTRLILESQHKYEWDLRARERALQERINNIAKKMLSRKASIEEVAEETGLSHDEVEALIID